MGKHVATVQIPLKEFERINDPLGIPSLEDLSDADLIARGANTHSNEGVFFVTFDDGSSLNFNLRSGVSNYYDDVVWTSADGRRDVVLDCEFKLGDIEVNIDGEDYIVKIEKVS